MARRLSRKRLFKINTKGEDLTSTSGGGIGPCMSSQTRLRDGQLVTTEINIDLGSSAGPASSFTYVGAAGDPNSYSVIGISSSVNNGTGLGHTPAEVMLINTTASAADGIGILTSGELMCVETPAGGGVHVGLVFANNQSGSGERLGTGGTILLSASAQTLGMNNEFDIDEDLNDKYLYLAHSGSGAAAYTAGKFVLRLHGYNVFDDV